MTETCQRRCIVDIDDRGRVRAHSNVAHVGMNPPDLCPGSGHPSREERARRKAKRADLLASLTSVMREEAPVILDAYLLRGDREDKSSKLLARVEDARRAALYEYNRRNKMKHRWPVEFTAHGCVGQDAFPTTYQCRFCQAALAITDVLQRLAAGAAGGNAAHGAAFVVRLFADHLTQCALEYLAGLRDGCAVTTVT